MLLTAQLFVDIESILTKDTDVFGSNCVVISKKVSVLKSINKRGIYFTDDEKKDLRMQGFTKSVSEFNVATFEVSATIGGSSGMSMLNSDLFFESIPSQFLDVETKDWTWEEGSPVIPIIIPENYINLYNFGYAESQNLPVISPKMISSVKFDIDIQGERGKGSYKGRIVGFSKKINSILVPEDFLNWANTHYGKGNNDKANRLLVEFSDPTDEAILRFFKEHHYNIDENDLQVNKLKFIFKTALSFSLIIALIIIALSIASVLLSFSLVIQRNIEQFSTLYSLGFPISTIGRYYRIVLGVSTFLSLGLGYILSHLTHQSIASMLSNYFNWQPEDDFLLAGAFLLFVVVFVLGQWQLFRAVKRAVRV